MAFMRKAGSAAVVSLAALLAGVNASAQESAPADKAANTGKFVTCVTEGVRGAFRQAFHTESRKTIAPGKERAVIRNVIVRQETSGISASCMSRVSGIPLDKMPSVNDEQRFPIFYRTHFEEKAFDEVLQAVGKMMPSIEEEGLKILKRKAGQKAALP
ncbi:MAG: hypothetical protein HYS17_06540 [Micavibrio aeruginosavorus]|uniref:Uncharacterized protein n=1 Tax=Micavibrio aeruginosavorus TaxID=349221 RepID=A0A7T5R0D1_9BACT|nr:MAG: hypothetical protein HYS17_06540 [Micavibrio aeruginosavorus]